MAESVYGEEFQVSSFKLNRDWRASQRAGSHGARAGEPSFCGYVAPCRPATASSARFAGRRSNW
jgi:hypothetical protein